MVKRIMMTSKKKFKERLNPFNYFGNPVQKYLRYGKKLFEKEQYDQALSAYKMVIEEDSQCMQAYLGIGDTYLEWGGIQNAKTAIEYYQRALGIDFTQIHIYYKIIKVYDRLGDNRNIMAEKKKLFIAKTLKDNPQNAMANNNMGVIQQKQKNYDSAIEFFIKAVKKNKFFDVARFNLAKALYKKGVSHPDPEKAKDIFMLGIMELERLLRSENDPQMLLLKAKFLIQLDEPKQALAHCEQAIKLDSTMKDAYATKSMIETKLGNLMDAFAAYESFQSLKKS
ncbi:MAG: tetratricopeptide repeat protein [Deltaproteobacteria bacterium]|jgi:tetratricopeptide (TPR) repeat protein|nr:tetratricopeptide repeat protein [Deltaproteobacteria bacterium]MBT4525941.1 tetratricopeptide repeat protein [Deltaproteobacteria bacterium]